MKLIDFVLPKYGLIRGRDAINILEVVSKNPRRMEVICSVRTNSFTEKSDITDEFVQLKFIFQGVILHKIFDENIRGILTEEEFEMYAESDTESAVMKIENSNLLGKNKGINNLKNLHHIILETYDFKIESLCEYLLVEKS